ncbi:MAG: glucose-6-phosphate isomerase [Bradyrhizobiaceae bacterium]|nr:glucose-6-phosphate isomerase [Bradyrhizobiaceae bacterium]
MAAPFEHSIETALQSGIGEGGIPGRAYLDQLRRSEEAIVDLRSAYTHRYPTFALLRQPERTDDLPEIAETAMMLAQSSDVVFLGTGGSSLGGQALAQLADYGVPGLGALRTKARVHFLDNLDPVTFERLLERLPLATTRFVAISKSGTTAETLMQTMAVIAALEQAELGGKIPEHLVGISEGPPGERKGLRELLEPRRCTVIEHDPNVGGRFSALTNVGLLPALVLGLDVRAIRAGAREILQPLVLGRSAKEIPAAIGAALSSAAAAEGKTMRVMMAYADRLERFTRWWVQLWAESLGKKGKGATPIAALGPVDQHSQLQLWLGGPRDKLFTVITTGVAGLGPKMDKVLAGQAAEPGLADKTMGDLVAAEGRATAETLAKHGRPVRMIHVEQLDERAIGALMMHFMLETIIAAHLLGVDPFGQPAVEEGKMLAKRYLADGE